MSELAPDYVEPTRGWRAWTLDWTGPVARLAGIVRGGVWPAGLPARAECRHLPGWHPAPWSGCQCGLHATRVIEEAAHYVELPSRSHEITAIGRVWLWGDVIEAERGWRGSHAYPERLYVPLRDERDRSALEHVTRDLTSYGVPVEILDCRLAGVADRLAVVSGDNALTPSSSPVALTPVRTQNPIGGYVLAHAVGHRSR